MKQLLSILLLFPSLCYGQYRRQVWSDTGANLLLWALIIGFIYYVVTSGRAAKAKEAERVRQIQEEEAERARQMREYELKIERDYQLSLHGTDKAKALELGRIYYSYKRGGTLTLYDEQALTNDLSTMK